MTRNRTGIGDLAGKSLKIITSNGRDRIVRSKLWKEADLDSRDGNPVAISLEKRPLIKRVRLFENVRWTYRLLPNKIPVRIDCIESAPCLSCPVEHMCSDDSLYSPNNCLLLEDWIAVSLIDRTQIKQEIEDHVQQESERVQYEDLNRSKLLVKVSKFNRNSNVMRRWQRKK